MKQCIRGKVYEGKLSKRLLQDLPLRSIALLWHEDLDSVTTDILLEKEVKAVINRRSTMSGRYEHSEVTRLLDAGVAVFDVESWYGSDESLKGDDIWVMNNQLYVFIDDTYQLLAELKNYDYNLIETLNERAQVCYPELLSSFIDNSLLHAKRDAETFSKPVELPSCFNQMNQRPVLIVARNGQYKRDLLAMQRWLFLTNPLIIAVDGAADGLLELGFTPDFIMGDMDSVSSVALGCGAELICHTYADGSSPGLDRLRVDGIDAHEISFIGTSEDVAVMAAHWSKAAHLYLIGCRLGIKEFLEKQRAGMGSTILSRMEVGDRITDLKGIHQLFEAASLSSQLKRVRFDLKTELVELQELLGRGYRLLVKKGAVRHD